jgi:hypothetical protein
VDDREEVGLVMNQEQRKNPLEQVVTLELVEVVAAEELVQQGPIEV